VELANTAKQSLQAPRSSHLMDSTSNSQITTQRRPYAPRRPTCSLPAVSHHQIISVLAICLYLLRS
jgi:hypothetical protein